MIDRRSGGPLLDLLDVDAVHGSGSVQRLLLIARCRDHQRIENERLRKELDATQIKRRRADTDAVQAPRLVAVRLQHQGVVARQYVSEPEVAVVIRRSRTDRPVARGNELNDDPRDGLADSRIDHSSRGEFLLSECRRLHEPERCGDCASEDKKNGQSLTR